LRTWGSLFAPRQDHHEHQPQHHDVAFHHLIQQAVAHLASDDDEEHERKNQMTEHVTSPILRAFEQGERVFLSETWYQVWKTTGETTNGVMDTWFEVVPPAMGPPEHLHTNFDECFWIVKGTFLIKVAGTTVNASEGAWIFVPRGAAHAFRNVGTENGQLLILALPAARMRQYFEEVSAALRAQPVDQQALHSIEERYGVIIVGPPLEAEIK
jgi:mannose-6-phosphate isomerase-like protein (cupin superfamily)